MHPCGDRRENFKIMEEGEKAPMFVVIRFPGDVHPSMVESLCVRNTSASLCFFLPATVLPRCCFSRPSRFGSARLLLFFFSVSQVCGEAPCIIEGFTPAPAVVGGGTSAPVGEDCFWCFGAVAPLRLVSCWAVCWVHVFVSAGALLCLP